MKKPAQLGKDVGLHEGRHGTVECVRVSETAAFTRIQGTDGTDETFILWFNPGVAIPLTLTSFTRIVHSVWLSNASRGAGQRPYCPDQLSDWLRRRQLDPRATQMIVAVTAPHVHAPH